MKVYAVYFFSSYLCAAATVVAVSENSRTRRISVPLLSKDAGESLIILNESEGLTER